MCRFASCSSFRFRSANFFADWSPIFVFTHCCFVCCSPFRFRSANFFADWVFVLFVLLLFACFSISLVLGLILPIFPIRCFLITHFCVTIVIPHCLSDWLCVSYQNQPVRAGYGLITPIVLLIFRSQFCCLSVVPYWVFLPAPLSPSFWVSSCFPGGFRLFLRPQNFWLLDFCIFACFTKSLVFGLILPKFFYSMRLITNFCVAIVIYRC